MEENSRLTLRHYLLIVMCAFGWFGILATAMRFSNYYALLQAAMNYTDAQMGHIISMIGVTCMISYVFGGILADTLGPKLCIIAGGTISNVGSILLLCGIPFDATIPISLFMCMGGCVFCTSMLRQLSTCVGKGANGKIMGYFYAIMGLISLIMGNILSSVMSRYSAHSGLRFLMLTAVICIVCAMVAVCLLNNTIPLLPRKWAEHNPNTSRFRFGQVLLLFQNRRYWVLMVICITTVSCAQLMTYTQPLLTSQFGLSPSTVNTIAAWTNHGTIFVFSCITGILVDWLGSAASIFRFSYCALIAACMIVLLTPWRPAFVPLIVIAMICIVSNEGVGKPGRQLLISECGLPASIYGTAIGFLSVVMDIPTAIFGSGFSYVMETFDGRTAYQILYSLFIVIAITGLTALSVFIRLKEMVYVQAERKYMV